MTGSGLCLSAYGYIHLKVYIYTVKTVKYFYR